AGELAAMASRAMLGIRDRLDGHARLVESMAIRAIQRGAAGPLDDPARGHALEVSRFEPEVLGVVQRDVRAVTNRLVAEPSPHRSLVLTADVDGELRMVRCKAGDPGREPTRALEKAFLV